MERGCAVCRSEAPSAPHQPLCCRREAQALSARRGGAGPRLTRGWAPACVCEQIAGGSEVGHRRRHELRDAEHLVPVLDPDAPVAVRVLELRSSRWEGAAACSVRVGGCACARVCVEGRATKPKGAQRGPRSATGLGHAMQGERKGRRCCSHTSRHTVTFARLSIMDSEMYTHHIIAARGRLGRALDGDTSSTGGWGWEVPGQGKGVRSE